MRKALTEKTLAALRPGAKRYEVRDITHPGFGARVHPNGIKTLFVTIRHGTKQRRIKVGVHPRDSLKEAREKAYQAQRMAEEGIDPAYVRRMPDYLLRKVAEEYVEKYARVKTRGWKSARALLMREIVGPYGERDIRKIGRADIITILDDMVRKGHNAQANRFLAYVRRMFNWCVERGILSASPVNGIKAPCKEQSRERVLADDEVGRILGVCRQFGYPFGSLFEVILLCAQRRGEVAGMRWSELDLTNMVWHLPSARTKNGRAHSVPLSQAVMEILNSIPRFEDTDIVFTTNGCTPVSGFGKPFKRLSDEAKVQAWYLHDLRRTAASGMARLGVQPYVIEKILNHVTGQISGIAATYNRFGYDSEKRDALEKWSHHCMNAVTRTTSI